MKSWLKKLHPAHCVVLVSMAVSLVLIILLGISSNYAGTNYGSWVGYYTQALGGSFVGMLYPATMFICLIILAAVIWALGKNFLAIIFPKWWDENKIDPRETFIYAMKRSVEAMLIVPAILFITFVAIGMAEANAFAPARLQDQAVIGWEHWIFGNYVFAALGSVQYPHFLIMFIIISFQNMGSILIFAGMLMAYMGSKRFWELIIAFCIGILMMVPLWLMVPALSPQDRFINNVYHLPVSAQIASAVQDYHPQKEIADFLASVRADKAGLPSLPTSTMPSAHVFWATLAGYYLFRTKKWLGWIALPFLAASTFGTVLLAQHYFMDIPVGIAIAAFSIWLAEGVEWPLIVDPETSSG